MADFIGQCGPLALFSNGESGVVIDSELRLVTESGSSTALYSSREWSAPGVDADASLIDLADGALSTLDIRVIVASGRMYTIPRGVQAEAKKALKWRKEHKRGGTPVGMNTARTLAGGGQIGIEKVRHVAKYFPRHEIDKKGKGWEPGEDGFPSRGRIAWALWGGDAAWRWAQAIVERENKKALTADGYATPALRLDASDYHTGSRYGTDVDAFKDAYEMDESAGPEFVARVRMDGGGIDRLYKIDLDGQVYVWDCDGWDDLGHVDGDVYTYDRALDDPYDRVDRDYFVIDPDSAIIISARMQQNPFDTVSIADIDAVEARLVALAIEGEDWGAVDRALIAAGEPAPAGGDGDYTPEERAQNASKQVRDAGGKFAAKGKRVSVNGTQRGVVTAVNGADQTVTVKLDSGKEVEVSAKATRQLKAEENQPAASAPGDESGAPMPLDTSGILAEPRTPINSPKAQLPGTLPAMTGEELKSVMYDYPAWVKSQRDKLLPGRGMAPVKVQPKNSLDLGRRGSDLTKSTGKKLTIDSYDHPLLRDWLDKRNSAGDYPNRLWYDPITSAGDVKPTAPSATETAQTDTKAVELTPETSDVPPMYFAIVSPDDPRAVLDLISVVPASSTSNLPSAFKRTGGKWQRDEGIIGDLNSATPPPVVPLDSATLESVMMQVDETTAVTAGGTALDHVIMVLWGPLPERMAPPRDEWLDYDAERDEYDDLDVFSIVAAGGADRNRGNAEALRRYWTKGKGAAKIRWGKGGDWKRCVRYLSKYLGARAKGYCQLRHKDALGYYTSTHAKMIRKARGRNNSVIEFSGGLDEALYEVPVPEMYSDVPETDLEMDVDAIRAERDDMYDESWEPDEIVVVALDELAKCGEEEYQTLIAAGSLDRNRGNAEQLRRYWTIGKGAAKIRWGTKGDWTRCVRQLSKYMGPRAKGYCALRHHEVTGMWTGDKTHSQLYGREGARSVFSTDVLVSSEQFVELSMLRARADEARARVALTAGGDYGTERGARFFIPLVIPEDYESGDGRQFEKESIDMRDLPLPLLWQIKTGEGHMGSVVVGRIDHMERVENGIGNAHGVFDTGVYGREAERLVRHGFIRGVSADMDKFEAEEVTAEVDGEDGSKVEKQKLRIKQARVMAVTIVPKPAFQECSIRVIEDYDSPVAEQEETVIPDGVYVEEVDATEAAAIVASGLIAGAIPVVPPTDWFEKPSLKKATPLTVTDDGRVFGHIAAWHVDHIGMSFGTKPPRSRSNYAYFHTGVVRTEEGTDVPVGQLTLAGGHAPLEADAFSAARHYDDTASAIADVHAGEDSYGIWVAGALRPGTTPEQVRALRASAPSGDWRPIQGKLELVAVCQVNVPGFPIARARVASGQVVALVAAGANVLARLKSDPVAELTARVNRMESERVANVAADARARFSALRAELDIQPVTAGVYEVNDNTYQKDKAGKLVEELEQLLPNVFSFYIRTHGYHWNVKGEDFAQYHELFSNIYEDVFGSVDTIAESIRKLGSDAPFSLRELSAESSIGESTIHGADPISMSYDLYVTNERLIDQLKSAFRCANECDEQGIANFIAERIDAHQKWRWQLRSSVTPENMQVLSERYESAETSDEDRVYMSTFTALAASGAENFDQFDRATALSIIKTEVASRFRGTAAELSVEEFKNFSPEERDELAKKGWALKDGSYPIRNVQDLKNAIKAYGRSPLKGRLDVRKHIIKRAKALDARDLIPEQWGNPKNSPSHYSVENGDTDSGKASAAEFAGGIYTPKTQPRDIKGKFRQVLARIKEDAGVSGIQTVLDKVQEAENYDSTGNYVAAAKAATDLLGIIDRIDTQALTPGSLENVRLSARELGKTIANLPLPFGKENEKVRYSDLPPALRSLIESMIDKVEQRIGQEDSDEATAELRSFMSGGDYLNQSEISSQMSTLLRLLT